MDKAAVNTVKCRTVDYRRNVNNRKVKIEKEKLLLFSVITVVLVYFIIIIIPMISIIKSAGLSNTVFVLNSHENLSAIGISLLTTTLASALSIIIGTPVVFILMYNKNSVFTKLLDMIVNLPTVLPPAVAGLGLLLAFGSNGLIGKLLESFGINIVFTLYAVILAQFFVASGIYIKILKTATDAIEPEILEISYVLGAGKIETFIKIVVPMVKKHIAAALILSWTRALGEFGATIMFAGNVLGKTRTVPLQIYTLMQTDITQAASLSIVLFAISFIMLFVIKMWLKE